MLQAGEDPSADVCGVCNHRHHQGTKCGICGHVGKSQIYHRMKSKAASYGTCKTDFYGLVPVMKDGNNPLYGGTSNILEMSEVWNMVKELRKGLLINPVTGMSVGLESEFNAEQEQTSRHLVCQLGDMPVAVGRFSLIFNDEAAEVCVVIDRFGVFPSKRGVSAEEITASCVGALLHDAHALISVGRPMWEEGRFRRFVQVPKLETFAPLVGSLQTFQLALLDTPPVTRAGVEFVTFG